MLKQNQLRRFKDASSTGLAEPIPPSGSFTQVTDDRSLAKKLIRTGSSVFIALKINQPFSVDDHSNLVVYFSFEETVL